MPSVFDKLNLKDQKQIVVLNAPASFEPELAGLRDVVVQRALSGIKQIEFSLAFVTKQSEVDTLGKSIAAKAAGDPVIWFAYPKGSSKKYKCEFNRDAGWDTIGKLGLEPVRMVAIDEDWSAVRFRRVEFIKTLTRSRAVSPQAQARLAKK
jgi:hypothetical protein